MPCLFFYALLNAYRLVLVVVAAGLRVVLVLVLVAAGLRVVVVRCTVVVLPVLSVCLIVVRVVPSFFTRLSIVVCTAGLRVVLVLVVGFAVVVGFVVVVVAGLRVEVPLCVDDGWVVVLVPLLVCVRSSPALRIVTPEPLADTRLSNAYSGCC